MTTTLSSISTSPLPWPNQRELPAVTRPLPAGTTVISADSHWLETGEFVDRMPAKYRDRAPRGVFNERGFHMEIDGQSTDNPGMPSELIEGRAGMWDAGVRVEEITREGVDQEILFPQRMLGVIRNQDFDYIQACMDAYNEMLAEFCAAHPDRLHGLALLNYWNPEATEDELQKIKALGFKGVLMPSLPPPHAKVYYNARALEPLWRAIGESGLPLSFHVGETFDARGQGGLATTIVVAFQPFRRLFALLTFAGIFERNPGLRVVFTEGGISWVPSALFDCDKVYASFESEMTPKTGQPAQPLLVRELLRHVHRGPERPAPARPDRNGQSALGQRLPPPRKRRRLHPAVRVGRLRRLRQHRSRPKHSRRQRPTALGFGLTNWRPPRLAEPHEECSIAVTDRNREPWVEFLFEGPPGRGGGSACGWTAAGRLVGSRAAGRR